MYLEEGQAVATNGQECQVAKEAKPAFCILRLLRINPSPGKKPKPVPKQLLGGQGWSLMLALGGPVHSDHWIPLLGQLAKAGSPPLLLALGSVGSVQTMQFLLPCHCALEFRGILVASCARKVRMELQGFGGSQL